MPQNVQRHAHAPTVRPAPSSEPHTVRGADADVGRRGRGGAGGPSDDPVPHHVQQLSPRSKAAAVDTLAIRIANFGRVSQGFYRGAQPQGRDYGDLAALGVKTVINLSSHDAQPDEQMMVERAGMTYLQVPMTTHVPPTADQVAQFLGVVSDSAHQPVYVHCVGGKHRTGVMTAVYRMTQEAWTADQAFREMKLYKFGADFLHAEFKKFVFGYHVDVATREAAPPGNTTK